MSWAPPASDPGRRSASHDISRIRRSSAYHDIQEPMRIVSDDVMARNRGSHSPSSLTSFGDSLYSHSNTSQRPSIGSYPVNAINEVDLEEPRTSGSKFMETFSRTSSTSSRHAGVSDEEQQTLDPNPILNTSGNSPNVNPSTSVSNVNQFSFSEADESTREFHYSPRQGYDEGLENADFVSIKTSPRSQSEDDTNTIQSLSPPKSLMSGNSNLVGSIIGKYDYSTSAVALNPGSEFRGTPTSLATGSVYSNGSRPNLQQPEGDQNKTKEPVKEQNRHSQESESSKRGEHLRNNSASSTLSTTSTSSTLTKSNNQQRFLRYAMSARSSQPALNPTSRWSMDNVIGWLEFHNFQSTWKETFKRNEISGNRFLELGNYDSTSMVWRQFSRSLNVGGDNSEVDRFIHLLRSELHEIENPSSATSTTLAPPEIEVQKRAENRKSSATLTTQLSSTVPTKPRPYSYVEPSTSSKANPNRETSQQHGHKFFRLHHRTPSTDSTKANASTASLVGDDPRNSTGQRMSGIFSSIWKYSGDKAAGIVKQVHTSTGSSGGRHTSGNKRGSYVMPQHRRADSANKNTSFMNRDSLISLQRSQDDSTLSPISTNSAGFPPFEVGESSAESDRSLSADIKKEVVDARYLPVPKSSLQDESKLILLSKDNVSFKPLRIYSKDLDDLESLKKKILKSLDLLNFGLITFHLTDYDCIPGEPMSDDVIIQALHQSTLSKIHVQQIVNSPGTNTISSTSSDARSFDLSGDNNGRMYPATPQYLLQDPRDKGVDYLNFKDHEAFSQIKYAKDARGHTAQFQHPLKLTIPANKRVIKHNLLNPNTNQQGRKVEFKESAQAQDQLDPTERWRASSDAKVHNSTSPSAVKELNTLSNEERSNLSSKAIRSAIFREGAAKDASRASSSGSEYDRSNNFIAKRKAPPPPTGTIRSRTISGSSVSPALSRNSSGRRITSKSSSVRKQEEEAIAFTEHEFNFEDAPSFSRSSARSPLKTDMPTPDTNHDSDNDDFFVKPMSRKERSTSDNETDSDEEDFFMKPTKQTRSAELREMNVRPPVEEVYNNLEKYFPNTNLDKPIIDASPESPVAQAISSRRTFPTQRKESISRTFSNANNSPINPPTDEDDVIPVDNGEKPFKRMKTIRTVANEARKKRLAGSSTNKKYPEPLAKTANEKSPGSLRRSNTKLWGQKLVEVTSAEIEKGFVSRIRSSASSKFEEFAWIKGELIGRGSFGSVYLALNVTTGEMLAVKQVVVNDSWNKTSDGLDALHKEVETMKDLDHLNIVQYLGFEQKMNTYSLFLEYVGGGSISSCLKSFGKFDEQLVKFITRQVLDGLRYLHSNGILHRDLKADNLLLETDGTCKISDFGISKKSQDIYSNNAEMSMQGTVFWMAPEVIHNIVEDKKQGYSAKVDIWSLGCVVLEMFAGQRPWSNEAVISAIYKIGKTKLAPPIPEDVSDEAKDFLKKCFTTDSQIRPTAEKLLEHPFMEKDPNFRFNDTKLREVIKFNTRRV